MLRRLVAPTLLTFALALSGAGCFSGDPGDAVDARVRTDGAGRDGVPVDGGMCEGTLPFMSGCADNAECAESCLCFPFGNKGPHCTHPCDGPEDCPLPSGGCGGQGVCKPP